MSSIPSSFNPYLAYSASAGSGKTFALAVRYISLLFLGESPNTILAATFTNKAAAEMRERVVDSLRLLGEVENRAFLEAISLQTEIPPFELLQKQPLVLQRFLQSSNFIVTLDSFFASILRASSFELGLEPEFVTKEQKPKMLEELFLEEIKVMGLLDSLAKLAIDIEDRRFAKLFELMQNFYRLDPILPKSRRASYQLPVLEESIHKIRLELLEMLIESGASKSAINNFREENIAPLFKKPLFQKESLLEHKNYKKYVEKNPFIDQHYQELKLLLFRWIETKEAIILEHLFELYSYFKNATITNAKHSNILTFDDLSFFTYRLLYETVSKEFIYFKIDSKFRHILLDEFQDTSSLQYLLLKPLIEEIFAGRGQNEFRSFFYVGDTKQSLYRFRGGVEELFDKVALEFGVTIEQMDTNYRSSKAVIEQVNEWFVGVMEGYLPQNSKPQASEGFVKVIEPIEDEEQEESTRLLLSAVNQAKEMIQRGICVDEIAFLVFTNKDGASLQELCHYEGIETILKTSSSLQRIAKVASIVAVIKYLFYGKSQYYSAFLSAFLDRVGMRDAKFEWFHPYLNPFEIIDKLIREFGYFESDPNLLKLLSFASNYTTVPEFIEEFESASLSVASNSIHGAKIMTIHGSKGLEFERVIVVDKLTRPNSDRDPLLFRFDDDLSIERVYYRTANRDQFDFAYKELLAQRSIASRKDSLNVLYVALTRAVEEMIIIKKREKSIFDLLRIDITSRGTPSKPSNFISAPLAPKELAPITIRHYGRQNSTTPKEEEEIRDYDAINFGLALHYTLEMMAHFDIESLIHALESSKNHYGTLLDETQWSDITSRITDLINDTTFMALFRGARSIHEQSISYQGELKQIDLLLEYPQSYLVIDYKSSYKYHTKHIQQVQYYTQAIGSITNKETEGMIIYLLRDEVKIERV